MMPETPAMDTVTEAVAFLESRDYTTDLMLARGGVKETGGTDVHPPSACSVDYQFRFEGASDPGDEDIVLGVRLSDGTKGIITSAYGKDTDPEHAEVLQALTAAR
jgi:hypothetical protein